MRLTDAQWARIEPLLPSRPRRGDGKGRPWSEARPVVEGILWVLVSGARWKDLPKEYPSYQTCHRWFQRLSQSGRLLEMLQGFAKELEERGGLDLSECYVDGSFSSAKRGATAFGKTKRGKGTKLMTVADKSGPPVALVVSSASPHEITLLEETLDAKLTLDYPERLVGDEAYDSDGHDVWLKEQYGTELIAPHRSGRKTKTQDGRPLRRYKRRWKIERLFAWLHNFRRVVTRYDRKLANYLAFVQLACVIILLKRILSNS
ncbi:MAG: IS5 family transposase [Fimbriimonas sp.]